MDSRIEVRNDHDSRSYDAVLDGRVVGIIVYERVASRLMIRHPVADQRDRVTGSPDDALSRRSRTSGSPATEVSPGTAEAA